MSGEPLLIAAALVTIYISGPGGQYATNVEASSSHEAVRKGVEFFLDPLWKRPKRRTGTALCVCPKGGKEIRVRVRADDVMSGKRLPGAVHSATARPEN